MFKQRKILNGKLQEFGKEHNFQWGNWETISKLKKRNTSACFCKGTFYLEMSFYTNFCTRIEIWNTSFILDIQDFDVSIFKSFNRVSFFSLIQCHGCLIDTSVKWQNLVVWNPIVIHSSINWWMESIQRVCNQIRYNCSNRFWYGRTMQTYLFDRIPIFG